MTCLNDRNDSPLRWRSLHDWVYMNSHDCSLCRSRHGLGKTAGDPHPSGPVSAPVFPLLAFLHVAGGLALFFALASPPQ